MYTPVQLHAAAKCYYYCTVELQIAVCNINLSVQISELSDSCSCL